MTLKNFLPIFLAIVLAMLLSGCPEGIILPTPTDWGDAPDKPYPTVEADNGARHIIVEKFHLGGRIDAETDGQPNATATGDDIANLPDEDGVTFTSPLIPGQMATITVVASAIGKLDAWLDFNHDGSWATPGDQIFASALLSAGNNYLTFPVPASSITGNSFARFRFSSAGGLSYTGLAKDGEVEDYQISIVNQPPRVDWGDAPGNPMIPNSYPTLAADNGARHIILNNILHLGLLIDSEPDGQPDVNATGDDLNNLLDEDGVTFTSPIRRGLMATINVVSSAVGKLDVWIDFNRDGSWATTGDHIFVSYPLVAGTNQLTFPVPASASVGRTYGRFRLSSAGGLSYSGWAMDGEVEDYQFGIE